MNNWRVRKPVIEAKRAAPEVTLDVFEDHWAHVLKEIQAEEATENNALAVISYMKKMISLFGYARREDPEQICKHFWIENRCVERTLTWLHDVKNKGLILPGDQDISLVQMLHSLCELADREGAVIGYLNGSAETIDRVQFTGASPLAGLLIEYSMDNDTNIADYARHSFLLLVKLAKRYPDLEKCLGSGHSNFVISGLSARFAELPTYTRGSAEQMRPFIQQLKFVDDVCNTATTEMADGLSKCFMNAFLETVMKPALIQTEVLGEKLNCNSLIQDEESRSLHKPSDQLLTSVYEDEAVITYYLQTMCDLVTHPLLIHKIFYFVISMLPVLHQRLNHSNVSISISTLALFNSMLNLHCEDFWFHVILKYLLPQSHRMVKHRKTKIQDADFSDSSIRFLSLLPLSVMDAIGSETLCYDYLQYLNNESKHVAGLDAIRLEQLSPRNDFITELEEFPNPAYPLWKLRYDGTDDIEISVSDSVEMNGKYEQISNGPVTLLKTVPSHLESPEDDVKNDSGIITKFSSVSLDGESTDASPGTESDPLSQNGALSNSDCSPDVTTPATSTAFGALQSDGYDSLSSKALLRHDPVIPSSPGKKATFGPFLDTLLRQLSNWSTLDPDMLLYVTETLSLIARSRIPLVSSLILDPTLIMQPSFSSVASILNGIKGELDQYLASYPNLIIDVYASMADERRPSNVSTMSTYSRDSSDNESISSVSSSISEIMKQKVGGFKSAFSRFMNSTNINSSPLPSGPESIQEVPQGYKYTNAHAATATSPGPASIPSAHHQQAYDAPARLMATRAIYFTHWMLELAAISQQLSWKLHCSN